MSGRLYNISRLISHNDCIYYEGRPLLSAQISINVNICNVHNDPISVAKNQQFCRFKLFDRTVIKLWFIYTYPEYNENDFICYSLFKIIFIKVSDYREVINDLNYLKFMKLRNGISKVLSIFMQDNFDCAITDAPYLFEGFNKDLIDLNNFDFYSKEFYQDIDYKKTLNIDPNKKYLICLCHDQFLAFSIYKSIGKDKAFPLTIVRYPVRKTIENCTDLPRRISG